MFSLLIDTHSNEMNLILYKDSKLYDSICKTYNNQSKMLVPSIVSLLENNNITTSDLKEIVAVNGPGSFTGIRIGVTVAKTLAYSLNIPIKSISSIYLKAISTYQEKDYSVVMPDNKGYYIGEFEFGKLKKQYFYLSKDEFDNYKESHNIIENPIIDWNKIFEIDCLTAEDCYNIKPLYIKKIEVEK
jgi:tRNA threonylcarbamoyl adenosine modification protein YeaZ